MNKEGVYHQEEIISRLAKIVKDEFLNEGTGHDWWHIERVWKMARRIVKEEKVQVNMLVVETSALLHDIADWKFHKGDENAGSNRAKKILTALNVDIDVINDICQIIKNISFKGGGVASEMKSLEGKIVQDADRLDALGAIGIARVFAYNGSIGQPIYNPNVKPYLHQSFEEYKTRPTTAINHFYEKLLLIKDRLNTQTAKKIAQSRHKFIKEYLKRFYQEWKGC